METKTHHSNLSVYTCPLDSFGVASSALFDQLFRQGGDKRIRKTAFNAVRKMFKQFKLIPTDAEVTHISISVDTAGQIGYQVLYIPFPNQKE